MGGGLIGKASHRRKLIVNHVLSSICYPPQALFPLLNGIVMLYHFTYNPSFGISFDHGMTSGLLKS